MQEENFDNDNELDMDSDIDDIDENDESDEMEAEIYTLTDEEGKESDFELIGRHDVDGQSYVALAPVGEDVDEDDEDGFVVLKVAEEDGEEIFVTIDDDEEFDRIADIFEDELFSDTDYEEGEDPEEE
jgi:uncharacterized protein YrzB (UPF0473 family)